IARGLAPRVVAIDDVPLLAHFADQIRRERHRLRGGVIGRTEAIAVAFACRQRRVEAYADDVDDPRLLPDRHALEAYVGEEAADLHVDLDIVDQLLRLAAGDVGLRLIIGDHKLKRPAVDAAGFVDAIDRHRDADQRGLAAGSPGARKRLYGADLVWPGLAESRAPRRRHQYGCAQHAGAPPDQVAAGHLAPVPELACFLVVVLIITHFGVFLRRFFFRSRTVP